MRILRPKLVQGNINQRVGVGERIVVRGPLVYKLPPTPTWVNGNGKIRLNWLEKLIDGLIHRGWFKDSDIYIRVDPVGDAPNARPLAFIIPSYRGNAATVLNGKNINDLMEDAQIFDRLRDGALFMKTSP